MKKFVLSEIMLLSATEKKAKRVKFNKKRTLIYGGNGTGKSCLIKSIYKTFGASSIKDHPSWKALNPISFIRFKVDREAYSILKDGNFYAVFDSKDELIDVFRGVTKELSTFLAKLFDFKIQLPNQQNELVTPSPSFLFLPYYLDQDISWQRNWSGFSNLTYIKNFREPIAFYHTGLRPNEYYQTKGELELYAAAIKKLEDERKVLKNVLDKVKEKITQVDFNINIEKFQDEVRDLLVHCDVLKKKQEKLKSKLVEYYNLKIILESQLVITTKALKETKGDYAYATEILVDDFVDCPTCGAHYENSFLERFEIAKDEDRCKELMVELTRELEEIKEKIEKENSVFNQNNEEIVKMEAILENKKGQVKLKDVIDNAGRNELKLVFEENSKLLMDDIVKNANEYNHLQDKLKSLTDKSRRDEIMSMYYTFMKIYLHQLDVNTLRENSYRKIDANIPETGSALPRALIAYYFSIFQVMRKYTSSAYCPIIIDSPNQQDMDLEHIDKVFKFIDENQPTESQMILGLSELYNIDFDCDIVELKEEKSLLQKSDFKDVNQELDNYLSKIWNFNRGARLF